VADKRFFLSEYQADRILDAIDTDGQWLALLTTLPTNPDGTGLVEASGGNYGRASVAFDAASVGVMANTAAEYVPSAASTADLGTIVGWALYDAETGGNLVAYGELMLGESLGSSDTQFDITNPSGSIMRYTWDTTGTDPEITSAKPAAGDLVLINAQNFSAENNVVALVIDSGTNWFEIAKRTVGSATASSSRLASWSCGCSK